MHMVWPHKVGAQSDVLCVNITCVLYGMIQSWASASVAHQDATAVAAMG